MKDILGTREYPGRLRFDLYFVYIPVHRRLAIIRTLVRRMPIPARLKTAATFIFGKIPYRLLGRSVKRTLSFFKPRV
jgi:hypothetical protein